MYALSDLSYIMFHFSFFTLKIRKMHLPSYYLFDSGSGKILNLNSHFVKHIFYFQVMHFKGLWKTDN